VAAPDPLTAAAWKAKQAANANEVRNPQGRVVTVTSGCLGCGEPNWFQGTPHAFFQALTSPVGLSCTARTGATPCGRTFKMSAATAQVALTAGPPAPPYPPIGGIATSLRAAIFAAVKTPG